MNIKNKTSRAITVPLPRGKKLHLGPGLSGQINDKASDYPKFVALVESGDLEILDGGRNATLGSPGPDNAPLASKPRGLR